MASATPKTQPLHDLTERLAHVRWMTGGTASGKSTLTRLLADRHDVTVYSSDRAEHAWLERCTPHRHPHFTALRALPPGGMWHGRSGEEVFRTMPSLHGETVGFLVEDLLALPAERPVLVDYFGILPHHLAPLVRAHTQAVFLLPTPEFRRATLTSRYADTTRRRATWGSEDLTTALTKRLIRDALWDEEVRTQSASASAPQSFLTLTIDGTLPAPALADRLAAHFGLGSAP
ncbi:hypothetical protein [Streptomyces indicus]|uniref:Uncharacterized protein n=1 Tax=Streptomyces indicus TaxID=417292 RepID=A0A1G9BMF2_9ACTN|nr:hypothetical protein [Streptomyces indicus]SDK40324.1 hypothetical protein SAMN05421806_107126 [Streptomyces indicus]